MTDDSPAIVHRKPYRSKQSSWWWTRNAFLRWYMLREATALMVFFYSLLLIASLLRLSQGELAWNDWMHTLSSPLFVIFHLLILLAVLYHAYTWFILAPSIMVVRLGQWTLPKKMLLAGQWLGFLIISILLLYLALGSGGDYAH